MLYCFLFFQIVPVLSRPGWSRPQLRRLPCLALHFISRASRGQQPLLGPQLDQHLWVPTSWTSTFGFPVSWTGSFGFLASWTSSFGFPTSWTGSFGFLAIWTSSFGFLASWTSTFGFLASWTSPFGFPISWTGSFGFLASGASSLWFPQPQMAQVPQPALATAGHTIAAGCSRSPSS